MRFLKNLFGKKAKEADSETRLENEDFGDEDSSEEPTQSTVSKAYFQQSTAPLLSGGRGDAAEEVRLNIQNQMAETMFFGAGGLEGRQRENMTRETQEELGNIANKRLQQAHVPIHLTGQNSEGKKPQQTKVIVLKQGSKDTSDEGLGVEPSGLPWSNDTNPGGDSEEVVVRADAASANALSPKQERQVEALRESLPEREQQSLFTMEGGIALGNHRVFTKGGYEVFLYDRSYPPDTLWFCDGKICLADPNAVHDWRTLQGYDFQNGQLLPPEGALSLWTDSEGNYLPLRCLYNPVNHERLTYLSEVTQGMDGLIKIGPLGRLYIWDGIQWLASPDEVLSYGNLTRAEHTHEDGSPIWEEEVTIGGRCFKVEKDVLYEFDPEITDWEFCVSFRIVHGKVQEVDVTDRLWSSEALDSTTTQPTLPAAPEDFSAEKESAKATSPELQAVSVVQPEALVEDSVGGEEGNPDTTSEAEFTETLTEIALTKEAQVPVETQPSDSTEDEAWGDIVNRANIGVVLPNLNDAETQAPLSQTEEKESEVTENKSWLSAAEFVPMGVFALNGSGEVVKTTLDETSVIVCTMPEVSANFAGAWEKAGNPLWNVFYTGDAKPTELPVLGRTEYFQLLTGTELAQRLADVQFTPYKPGAVYVFGKYDGLEAFFGKSLSAEDATLLALLAEYMTDAEKLDVMLLPRFLAHYRVDKQSSWTEPYVLDRSAVLALMHDAVCVFDNRIGLTEGKHPEPYSPLLVRELPGLNMGEQKLELTLKVGPAMLLTGSALGVSLDDCLGFLQDCTISTRASLFTTNSAKLFQSGGQQPAVPTYVLSPEAGNHPLAHRLVEAWPAGVSPSKVQAYNTKVAVVVQELCDYLRSEGVLQEVAQ